MKKFLSVVITLIMILSVLTSCSAAETNKDAPAADATTNNFTLTMQIGNPNMTVNGKEKPIDEKGTAPVIINNRTLLPIRAVVEEFGGTVGWNGENQSVTLSCGNDEIKLTIDSTTAVLNGEEKTLDAAPIILNDRTMLPIRFIAESFKFGVAWEEKTQTVTITKSSDDETVNHKKTLVVYYSATGSTEKVANYIKDAANADIFKIEPVNEYSSSELDWTDSSSRVNAEHNDESKRDIKLKNTEVLNWAEYDTVFIGYPIWWGIAAWPVNNFVKENDISGKTVIPNCTSSRSPLGESGTLLSEMAGTGDWQTGMRFRSGASQSDVEKWLEEIRQGEITK